MYEFIKISTKYFRPYLDTFLSLTIMSDHENIMSCYVSKQPENCLSKHGSNSASCLFTSRQADSIQTSSLWVPPSAFIHRCEYSGTRAQRVEDVLELY